LSIIAKRREEEKKQDQGGWIFVGNGINGSGVNKRNTSDRRENNRENYSYLQDKKCKNILRYSGLESIELGKKRSKKCSRSSSKNRRS
jgi:hypothetical protein